MNLYAKKQITQSKLKCLPLKQKNYRTCVILSILPLCVFQSDLKASSNSEESICCNPYHHTIYAGPMVVGANFDVNIEQASVNPMRTLGGIV